MTASGGTRKPHSSYFRRTSSTYLITVALHVILHQTDDLFSTLAVIDAPAQLLINTKS